ncbi:Pyridoxal phosphate phosphatase [Thelohanellus kitauei]|uniref:Pyridoxal phosphate phosphatase n=1 Tax=Thelohanellus kitauei TaxID=669202 RepID=A0A0C2JA64_THEKT|nr:Pyridoxal phosphate phosphatase [Thelohanellus kitauei]
MFLATNTDAALPSSQGRELPGINCTKTGAGAMIAAVKAASLREPVIVGKPSPKMFDVIKTILDVDPATTCMVGDRIETDIKFGNDCGMKTVLVMSGVTSHQSYQMLERECSKGVESVKHVFSKPTFISETLYDLVLRLQ